MSSSNSKSTNERNAYNLSRISNSLLADDSIKWQEKVSVGVRFNPNDQVLADYYLARKIDGITDGPIFSLIKEIDIYNYEPSQLLSLAYDFGYGKMYFFTPFHKKYGKEMDVDRLVPGGFWKKTREVSYVKDGKGQKRRATKMMLAYYRNNKNSKPEMTQWRMKEYMLFDTQSSKQKHKESWTLCVIYEVKVNKQGESSKISGDDDDGDTSDKSLSGSE